MEAEISQIYGHRIRIRVCGFCWKEGRILMVNHSKLNQGDFWAPPGGGLEVAESAQKGLIREFKEETAIDIVPGKFLFTCEFIRSPLHAVELFFECEYRGGMLTVGTDPEMKGSVQLIKEVKWMLPEEITELPEANRHGCFSLDVHPAELMNRRGYWAI